MPNHFIQTKLLIIYFMVNYLFSVNFNKFLMTLISIEILMLTTGAMNFIELTNINSSFMIIYFLVFMVTESVLGLSLLIMMSRVHGNDFMKINEMNW